MSYTSQISTITSVDAHDEMVYVSGLFSGTTVDLFAAGIPLTSSSVGAGSDAFVAALDAGGSVSGPCRRYANVAEHWACTHRDPLGRRWMQR